MPESYGLSTPVAGGENRQLIARNSDVRTRPILLTDGADYPRGCLVFAATPEAQFVKVATGAMPAATDLIAIVSEAIDTTDIVEENGVKHVAYFAGEFVKDTVFRASADDLTAANILTLEEAMLRQGFNLVAERYSKFEPAA